MWACPWVGPGIGPWADLWAGPWVAPWPRPLPDAHTHPHPPPHSPPRRPHGAGRVLGRALPLPAAGRWVAAGAALGREGPGRRRALHGLPRAHPHPAGLRGAPTLHRPVRGEGGPCPTARGTHGTAPSIPTGTQGCPLGDPQRCPRGHLPHGHPTGPPVLPHVPYGCSVAVPRDPQLPPRTPSAAPVSHSAIPVTHGTVPLSSGPMTLRPVSHSCPMATPHLPHSTVPLPYSTVPVTRGAVPMSLVSPVIVLHTPHPPHGSAPRLCPPPPPHPTGLARG